MLSAIHKQELESYGFTIIRNFANLSKLELLNNQIIELSEKYKSKTITSGKDFNWLNIGDDHLLSSAHNLHNYKSSFYSFIKEHNSFEIFEELYSCKSSLHSNASYFAKPKQVGLATLPHQDMAFFNLEDSTVLTFWVALDSSNKNKGGIYYIKNNKKSKFLKHLANGNLGASMCLSKELINEKDIFCPDINPGDCIIHSPHVIHGSYSNKSNQSRRSINYTLTKVGNKINSESHSKYLNNLGSFLKEKKSNM